MVLKSIIRYMINRYLKNYIEQLDDEKLNFDLRNGLSKKDFFIKIFLIVFSGHVTLENLHLKPEALVGHFSNTIQQMEFLIHLG
jgi:hypothetical protein